MNKISKNCYLFSILMSLFLMNSFAQKITWVNTADTGDAFVLTNWQTEAGTVPTLQELQSATEFIIPATLKTLNANAQNFVAPNATLVLSGNISINFSTAELNHITLPAAANANGIVFNGNVTVGSLTSGDGTTLFLGANSTFTCNGNFDGAGVTLLGDIGSKVYFNNGPNGQITRLKALSSGSNEFKGDVFSFGNSEGDNFRFTGADNDNEFRFGYDATRTINLAGKIEGSGKFVVMNNNTVDVVANSSILSSYSGGDDDSIFFLSAFNSSNNSSLELNGTDKSVTLHQDATAVVNLNNFTIKSAYAISPSIELNCTGQVLFEKGGVLKNNITADKLIINGDIDIGDTTNSNVTFKTAQELNFNYKINSTQNSSLILDAPTIKLGATIGQTSPLKDITIKGTYEGENGKDSSITCTGILTFEKSAQLRGNIAAGSLFMNEYSSLLGNVASITTTGDQTYTGTTANDWFRINSTNGLTLTSGRNISFNGFLDSWDTADANPKDVTIEANNVEFFQSVGSKHPLKNLSIKANTSINLLQNIITTENQTYDGNIILKENTTFLAGTNTITFNGTINSRTGYAQNYNLTIGNDAQKTNATFNKTIGNTNPVGNLEIFGSTRIGENIKSTLNQIFYGAVTLTNNTTLIAGTTNRTATITFDNTVDSSGTFSPQNLIIGNNSIATQVNFMKAVGSNPTTKLGTLEVFGRARIYANISTTQNQTFYKEVILHNNVTLSAASILDGTKTITFEGTITSFNDADDKTKKSLTIGTTSQKTNAILKNKVGEPIPLKNILIYGTLTSSDTISADSISVTGTSSIGGNVTTTQAQNYTGAVTLTNDVNFIAGTNAAPSAITFESNIATDSTAQNPLDRNLQIGSDTIASTVLFKGNVGQNSQIKNLTIYGNTTLTGTKIIRVDNWLNPKNAIVNPDKTTVTIKENLTGNNNFNNFIIAGEKNSTSEIFGENQFTNFSCEVEGKILIFEENKTQTVSEKFTIHGTNSNEPNSFITLKSSLDGTQWKIDTPVDKVDIEYVTVQDSYSLNEFIVVKNSFYNNGNNTNWNLFGDYTWTGNSSANPTDWTDPKNWTFKPSTKPNFVPTTYPGQASKDDSVEIPNAATNNYPVVNFTTNLSLKKLSLSNQNSKLTIENSGNIQLSENTNPITNQGTIYFSSTGRITNAAAAPVQIMDATQGTVQFNESPISDIYSDAPSYFNLIINKNNSTLTILNPAKKIIVKNDFTINKNASLDGTGSSATIEVQNNATVNGEILNLENFIVNKKSFIGANISTNAEQTYNEDVTLTSDILFLASAINFNANINSDSTFRNFNIGDDGLGSGVGGTGSTQKSVDIKILGEVGNISAIKNLHFFGNTTLYKNVSTSEKQTYDKTLILQDNIIFLSKDFNLNAATTSTNFNISIKGQKITFSENAKITAASLLIENSDLLKMIAGTEIILTNGEFSKIGNGHSQISAKIKTQNKSISFNNETFIDGETSFDLTNDGAIAENSLTEKIQIGTVGNESDNLIISALDKTNQTQKKEVKFIAKNFFVEGNFVLFNGDVFLQTNLETKKDVVLLNGDSQKMFDDKKADGSVDSAKSGIANLFHYLNPLRTFANNLCPPSLSVFPATLPDGTQIIHTGIYFSTLKNFDNKKIIARQNFYDNGVNLISNSQWILSIKENDNSTNSFAEIYNASIKNCKVQENSTDALNGGIAGNGFAWISASENCINESGNLDDTNSEVNYLPTTIDGSYLRQKTGIAFTHPKILVCDPDGDAAEGRQTGPEIPNLSGTYSVRDNVIRIEFVKNNYSSFITDKSLQPKATSLIENSNNEISKAVAKGFFTFNETQNIFVESFIDAECTTSTDGKGDIAVFYLKSKNNEYWNIDATGTFVGNDTDTHGNKNDRYISLQIKKALDNVFATLTDDHKNRIGSYYETTGTPPTKNGNEGKSFTATESRCAIGEMFITFSLADFTSNKIYIYFDQPLANNITWKTYNPTEPNPTEDSFKIFANPNDAQNGTSQLDFFVEKIERNVLNENGLILTLNKNLSYENLLNGIKIVYGPTYLFNNKIHSKNRHVVQSGETHCISDFLVNSLDVQFAYDERNNEFVEKSNSPINLDEAAPIAVRDFSENSKTNKLFAEKNIMLVTKPLALDANKKSIFDYKLFADITPNENSQGKNFTKFSGIKTRAWIPLDAGNTFNNFSSTLNDSANIKSSDLPEIEKIIDDKEGKLKFYFHNNPEKSPLLNWQEGSNVRFMFEVKNIDGSQIEINHNFKPDLAAEKTPLYEFRIDNPAIFTSIDLWSFLIAKPQRQRGGVSIFSNVINATNKDFCTIEVNMPSKGNLRVIVMTADGNIVTYLENGQKTEGLHYYYWNGTNNSGSAVARGIYFVRVVGPDIDETRKVMVVK